MKNHNYIRFFLSFLLYTFVTASVDTSPFEESERKSKVTGRVVDSATNTPIYNANILIKGTQVGTTSNEEGLFTLESATVGTHDIHFSHINFEPHIHTHIFVAGKTDTITVKMEERAIPLSEIEVADTLFRPYGTGYHFNREDIIESGANTFGQLIQILIPRSRVREIDGNLYIQLQLRQTIYQRHERMREPYPLVIIDGMSLGTSPMGLWGIPPSHIENLTVIRPPESQSVYGPEATHGVIIIETTKTEDEDTLLSTPTLNMILGGFVVFMLAMIFLF